MIVVLSRSDIQPLEDIRSIRTCKERNKDEYFAPPWMQCSCRCIHCKSNDLELLMIELPDDDYDIHHTCRNCGIHFNHLDGETYITCEKCNYKKN